MFNSFSRYQPQLLGILRIVTGLLFLSHGLVKLFGFPPGAQPGQVELLSVVGIGGLIELVAGALIMIGLFTRPAAFIASGEMAVAYWGFHFAPDNPFPVANGGDAAILYCFIFLYFVVAGPGAFSVEGTNRARATRT
ncbi:DoxX family protein [Sphingosinicella sp. CPCC 101087]|uniref:DoxX family protein n=1 Tax=Sphingosinicella sp. CPCC 101087 TaxID=2497754 RepID=UPI00101B63DC|nr:DoxX family protein [Sphingosinicella sp. CPCC 101087]